MSVYVNKKTGKKTKVVNVINHENAGRSVEYQDDLGIGTIRLSRSKFVKQFFWLSGDRI